MGCNDDCPLGLDDPCGGPDSCVTVDVVEGETYLIRIAGNDNATGRFVFNLTTDLVLGPLSDQRLIEPLIEQIVARRSYCVVLESVVGELDLRIVKDQ